MSERILALFPDLVSPTLIGHGGFSCVYSAINKQTMNNVAVKVVAKSRIADEHAARNFRREIEISKKIDHPFIIQCYDVKEDNEAYYLLCEYATNDSLLVLVNKYGRISEEESLKIFCQIISVIRHLHEDCRIVHRDLKLENVLLTAGNWIRIIDFGFSVQLDEGTSMMETRCGSFPYAAPEMFRKKPYTNAVDIWSAGVILYVLLIGHFPFQDENACNLVQKICHDEPEYPTDLSGDAVRLLKRLLTKDYNNRITIAEIAEHPWVKKSPYSCLMSSQFASIAEFKVLPQTTRDIDREIVRMVLQDGISLAGFEFDLLYQRESQAVVMYRMVRRNKVVKAITAHVSSRSIRQFAILSSPPRSDLKGMRKDRKLAVLPRVNDESMRRRRKSALTFILTQGKAGDNVKRRRRMTDDVCHDEDL